MFLDVVNLVIGLLLIASMRQDQRAMATCPAGEQ